MLALINMPSPRQRKHILQVPAHGQQRRRFQINPGANSTPSGTNPRARRINCGAPSTTASNRIVAALQNLAVVHQERIGNPAQPRPRLVVINRNRLLAQIGRSHHQRPHPLISKQQMLQRRIRQKNSQPRNPRRNRLPQSRCPLASAPAQSAAQTVISSASSSAVSSQICPRRLQIPHHHRQRLSIAAFALSQPHHRRLIRCIHAQMKSAHPLDRHDLARQQQLNRRLPQPPLRRQIRVRPSCTSQTRGPQSQQAFGCA